MLRLHNLIPDLQEGSLISRKVTNGIFVIGLKTTSRLEENGGVCLGGRTGAKPVCNGCEALPHCGTARKREIFLKVEISDDGSFKALRETLTPADLLKEWTLVPEGSPIIVTFRDFLNGWTCRT